MNAARPRLPAPERRAALLDCACRVFSEGSYRGTTTAEIAGEAGVTEPILYRHFESKRDLYLACVEECWRRTRTLWEQAVATEPDPGRWVTAMALAFLESKEHRPLVTTLWIQALAEAPEDPEIAGPLRDHMREVHGFVADVMRRSQAAGGMQADRDPDAEAWIFIALGLLSMADRSVGGLMEEDWPAIVASRRRWLIGRD